ncbi:unnamed protein product [Caenorhabditis auriculariae]|uniref:Uncharacterized protein n=1 Tax=Caenorhabditis auriculariae TaxID=2777116 RepID=A0A8S1HJX9_9PELO|nr:unnamed protein product [Caenorhabditis auriculariae]
MESMMEESFLPDNTIDSSSVDLETYFQEAQRFFDRDLLKDAMKELMKIVAVKTDDFELLVKVYHMVAEISFSNKLFLQATDFHKKELYLQEALMNYSACVSCLLNIANIHHMQNKFASCKLSCTEAVLMAKKSKDEKLIEISIAKMCCAAVELAKQEEDGTRQSAMIEETNVLIASSIKRCGELNLAEALCDAYFAKAQLCTLLNEDSQATLFYQKCISLSRKGLAIFALEREKLVHRCFFGCYTILKKSNMKHVAVDALRSAIMSAQYCNDEERICYYHVCMAQLSYAKGQPIEAVSDGLNAFDFAREISHSEHGARASFILYVVLKSCGELRKAAYFLVYYSLYAYELEDGEMLANSLEHMKSLFAAHRAISLEKWEVDNTLDKLTLFLTVQESDCESLEKWRTSRANLHFGLFSTDTENKENESENDFLELLEKLQGGRLDEQRCNLAPSIGTNRNVKESNANKKKKKTVDFLPGLRLTSLSSQKLDKGFFSRMKNLKKLHSGPLSTKSKDETRSEKSEN